MMANMTQDTQQSFPCNEENLFKFLHDAYVPGLHIVCFNKVGGNGMSVGFYKGATRSRYSEIELDGGAELGWMALRSELEEALPLKPIQEGMQPWAMFTPRGERIVDAESVDTSAVGEALAQLGMGLVFQGGQFIWPGVKLGFERQISLYSVMPMGSPKFDRSQNVTLETLSLVPLVLSVKGFLTETECDHIQVRPVSFCLLDYCSSSLTWLLPGGCHSINGVLWGCADGPRQRQESLRFSNLADNVCRSCGRYLC